MSDPTTPEGRAELRELLAKATDRPWIAEYSGPTGNCVIPHDAQSTLEAVAFTRLLPAWHDAELIAAAVNALPALLDELDKAIEQRDLSKGIATWEHSTSLVRLERAREAEAALDRVRELADDLASSPMVGASSEEQWELDTRRAVGRELRRALDGDS